jgi:MFS family permease
VPGSSFTKSANMTRHAANKPVSPAPGIFSPLRYAVFRRIWTASLLSNLGLLVLGVGAAWSMTKISSSTSMVALVQTSLMLPVALVSRPAGAIADMFDRRIVGLVALSIALAGSISLSARPAGVIAGPPICLLFHHWQRNGLVRPAWQASVSEQVPQRRCPAVAIMGSATTLPAALGRRLAASGRAAGGRRIHHERASYICLFIVLFFGVV